MEKSVSDSALRGGLEREVLLDLLGDQAGGVEGRAGLEDDLLGLLGVELDLTNGSLGDEGVNLLQDVHICPRRGCPGDSWSQERAAWTRGESHSHPLSRARP